jgi:hypothetical protein
MWEQMRSRTKLVLILREGCKPNGESRRALVQLC